MNYKACAIAGSRAIVLNVGLRLFGELRRVNTACQGRNWQYSSFWTPAFAVLRYSCDWADFTTPIGNISPVFPFCDNGCTVVRISHRSLKDPMIPARRSVKNNCYTENSGVTISIPGFSLPTPYFQILKHPTVQNHRVFKYCNLKYNVTKTHCRNALCLLLYI